MRMLIAVLALFFGALPAASMSLPQMFAERCLAPVAQDAAWDTAGLKEADASVIGDYLVGDENALWVTPSKDALLAVRPYAPGHTIRFCGMTALPYPSVNAEELAEFNGTDFASLAAQHKLEPIANCWGLEARGTTTWMALGTVAGTDVAYTATLIRSATTVEAQASFPIFAYPTGDIRQDCVTMTLGDS